MPAKNTKVIPNVTPLILILLHISPTAQISEMTRIACK